MKKLLGIILTVFMLASFSFSYALDIPPLVSTDWLEKNLKASGLVIIDVRSQEDYRGGHIPEAINIPFSAYMVKRGELSDEMPDDGALAALLANAGIRESSRVVTVGKADNIGPEIGRVTRFLFVLSYAGVHQTGLLDGGINKWKKENRPISSDDVPSKAVTFTPKWNRALFADKNLVTGATGQGHLLCDVRPKGFYTGDSIKKPEVARGGHLPQAREVQVENLFDSEGFLIGKFFVFKPMAEIEKVFGASIGTDKKKGTITYCNTGVLSTLGWFLLERGLGYTNVRMYDGSMEEWTKDPAAPVVR
jgi:thiosulfate/3-mercaptopyruvate sulfurtransferase